MLDTDTVNKKARLTADAGIAIGPILFVIAVLGILAAAIAAGSGSFTTSTTGESNRTKAAALIEIGQNLKVGYDRIQVNVDFANIVIDPEETSGTSDLFSPSGGGIAPPSSTMSACPSAATTGCSAADGWNYPLIYMPNLGTQSATAGNRVAVLRVSAGVCDEINLKANGIAASTQAGGILETAAALGNFGAAYTTVLDAHTTWPLSGKSTGCVYNSTATTVVNPIATAAPANSYYFFQVLGVQ